MTEQNNEVGFSQNGMKQQQQKQQKPPRNMFPPSENFDSLDGGFSSFISSLGFSSRDVTLPTDTCPPTLSPSEEWSNLWLTTNTTNRSSSRIRKRKLETSQQTPKRRFKSTLLSLQFDESKVPDMTVNEKRSFFSFKCPRKFISNESEEAEDVDNESGGVGDLTKPTNNVVSLERQKLLLKRRKERSQKLRTSLRQISAKSMSFSSVTKPPEKDETDLVAEAENDEKTTVKEETISMSKTKRRKHEYDPKNPHYNSNCHGAQSHSCLLNLWRKNMSQRDIPKNIEEVHVEQKEETHAETQENGVVAVPRHLEGYDGPEINSVEKGSWTLLPIPARSPAARFPPDWIVERRSNKTYYIRCPKGNVYHSIRDGLGGLKQDGLGGLKQKKEKGAVSSTTAKTNNNADVVQSDRKQKKRNKSKKSAEKKSQSSSDQRQTPLTSMWMEKGVEKFLGSAPVWDDNSFVDEDLLLLRNIILYNRYQESLRKSNDKQKNQPNVNDPWINVNASFGGGSEINKGQISASISDTSYPSVSSSLNNHLKDPEVAPRTSGRARRSVNRMLHCDTGAALPSASSLHVHTLVEAKEYGEVASPSSLPREEEPPPQPFEVIIHPDVPVLADLHAHVAKVEISGLLGGKWVPATSDNDNVDRLNSSEPRNDSKIHSKLYVQACLPCVAVDDGSTDVEIDPVSMTDAQASLNAHGLVVVGWYHSHPAFDAKPSSTDLINQANYQAMFRDEVRSNAKGCNVEPFVGLIVRPPASPGESGSKNSSFNHFSKMFTDNANENEIYKKFVTSRRQPFVSEHTWFHVHREATTYSSRSHSLVKMGYSGVTLPDGQEGAFAMALRVKMRVRMGSCFDELLRQEMKKLPDGVLLQKLFDEKFIFSQDLQQKDQDGREQRCGDASGKSSSNHENSSTSRIREPMDTGEELEEWKKAILPLIRQRRENGFICDRGLRRAKELDVCQELFTMNGSEISSTHSKNSIANDLESTSSLRSINKQLKLLRSHLLLFCKSLENGVTPSNQNWKESVTSNDIEPGVFLKALEQRGNVNEKKSFPTNIGVWCCEICGHTFEKIQDNDGEERKSESWTKFQRHLEEHEARQEVPPVELLAGEGVCNFRMDDFLASIKRVANPQVDAADIVNRFRGVYPLPGSHSFMAVSLYENPTSNTKELKSIGLFDTDVEAALAYDAWARQSSSYAAASALVAALGIVGLHDHEHGEDGMNVNFFSNGKRNTACVGIPISVVQLPRHRPSPYRNVSGEKNKWRLQCTLGGSARYVATFKLESEAARAHNLIMIRGYKDNGNLPLNHVPLVMSKVTAEREGLDMKYITRPLFYWNKQSRNLIDLRKMEAFRERSSILNTSKNENNGIDGITTVSAPGKKDEQSIASQLKCINSADVQLKPNEVKSFELRKLNVESEVLQKNCLVGGLMNNSHHSMEGISSDIFPIFSSYETAAVHDTPNEMADFSSKSLSHNQGNRQTIKNKDITENLTEVSANDNFALSSLQSQWDGNSHKGAPAGTEISSEMIRFGRILQCALFDVNRRLHESRIPSFMTMVLETRFSSETRDHRDAMLNFKPKSNQNAAKTKIGSTKEEKAPAIWCSACDRIIIHAGLFDFDDAVDSSIPVKKKNKATVPPMIEILERHVVRPMHCLLIKILPPIGRTLMAGSCFSIRVTFSKQFEDALRFDLQRLKSCSRNFYDIICEEGDHCNSSSFLLQSDKGSKHNTPSTNCVCRQPSSLCSGVLSTGFLSECHLNIAVCNGLFHPFCCNGGFHQVHPPLELERTKISCSECAAYRMKLNRDVKLKSVGAKESDQSAENKNEGSSQLSFDSRTKASQNDSTEPRVYMGKNEKAANLPPAELHFPTNTYEDRQMESTAKSDGVQTDMFPSLRCTFGSSELKGLLSQIEAIVKYYYNWPEKRRSELCNPIQVGNDQNKTSKAGEEKSETSNKMTMDECDRMRIALAFHVSKLLCLEKHQHVGLLDIVCRFIRFSWRLPLSSFLESNKSEMRESGQASKNNNDESNEKIGLMKVSSDGDEKPIADEQTCQENNETISQQVPLEIHEGTESCDMEKDLILDKNVSSNADSGLADSAAPLQEDECLSTTDSIMEELFS